jgi:tRNA U38,U39,U40 pseudouridine synthase TruA
MHQKEVIMAKKKCFVSFDWENDRHYKYLLEAWDANPDFEFVFSDKTPTEIDSNNVARVKAAITAKINSATHSLIIVGKEANKQHKDHKLIGFKNWINFEVHQSKEAKNKIVAIKIDKSYESPDELLGAGASWAMSFTQEAILNALKAA